jgi:hypothetical protein
MFWWWWQEETFEETFCFKVRGSGRRRGRRGEEGDGTSSNHRQTSNTEYILHNVSDSLAQIYLQTLHRRAGRRVTSLYHTTLDPNAAPKNRRGQCNIWHHPHPQIRYTVAQILSCCEVYGLAWCVAKVLWGISLLGFMASIVSMADNQWLGKDLKGSCPALIEVLSLSWSQVTEESHEKPVMTEG